MDENDNCDHWAKEPAENKPKMKTILINFNISTPRFYKRKSLIQNLFYK